MTKILAGLLIAALPLSLATAQGTTAAKPKADAKTMRLYKGQNFTGEMYVVEGTRSSLMLEMNVGSIAVFPGEKWEVCEKPRFKGTCTIVDADMSNMGAVAIQSARAVKANK
jgi:hypothetical protein